MVGSRVGNYRILRELGRGGMGVVYAAEHEVIGRKVAIKVLHPDVSQDPRHAARFVLEARAAGQVRHPGLVETIDFGTLEDGASYLVMEYLEGEELGRRLERLGTSLGPAALPIARRIAEALAAAHARGIIHRDLKPGNVMLVSDPSDPGEDRVKILDFGLAKSLPGRDEARPAVRTSTNAVMGTPAYMSPEQCLSAATVTDRTDVYSLGIVLHEMLTGRLPFEASTSVDVMYAHVHRPPPSLLAMLPQAPPALADLVHAMLCKEPADRPDMEEVARRLEAMAPEASVERLPLLKVQRDRPVPERDIPTRLKDRPRGRALLAIPAVAVIAVVSALAWVYAPSGVGGGEDPGAVIESPTVDAGSERAVWRLETVPPGATVTRAGDRAVVGITPWETPAEAGAGAAEFVVTAPGYFDGRVALPRGRSRAERLVLTVVSDKAIPILE